MAPRELMQSHQYILMRTHQFVLMNSPLGISVAVTIALLAGCGAATVDTCRTDGECSGGACVAGRCRPLAGADLTVGDGSPSAIDLATSVGAADGGPSLDLTLAGDATAPACSFDNNGIIERKEEPFLVGLGGLFAVNAAGSTVPVKLAAQNGAWDFSAAVANERKVFDELLAPTGQWWSADFANASYAERIDDGQALFGVFHVTDTRLELLGVVSDQGGLQKTELTYATPIAVLQFPLSMGSTWTAESDVSGSAGGFAVFAHDKYQFTVDARGMTRVPVGTFDTLRLRMNFSETVGGFPTLTRVQYLHLAECFGAVARIRSKDNEPSNDFTDAAEYRRLATQ